MCANWWTGTNIGIAVHKNMKPQHTKCWSVLAGLLCLAGTIFAAPADSNRGVELVVAADAAPAVRFGAAELRRALEESSAQKTAGLRIVLDDSKLQGQPESYSVSTPAAN